MRCTLLSLSVFALGVVGEASVSTSCTEGSVSSSLPYASKPGVSSSKTILSTVTSPASYPITLASNSTTKPSSKLVSSPKASEKGAYPSKVTVTVSSVTVETVYTTTTQTVSDACATPSSSSFTSSSSSGSSSDHPFSYGDQKYLDSVPRQVLKPAVHWDHPIDDLSNLAPVDSAQLYYASHGSADQYVPHTFASLNTTLQHECVILDHSSYVADTTCSADGILVTFNCTEAFQYAASSWSAVSEFVLATYTSGCGFTRDQRTFWLINDISLKNATYSILARVEKEVDIGDVLDGVDMVWGAYHPPGYNSSSPYGSNGGNGTSGSGSGSKSGGNPSNNGSPCGSAPSDKINGLPSAGCGDENFDSELDSDIGYFDFGPGADYGNDVEAFTPGVEYNSTDLQDDDAIFKRSVRLQKRGAWDWFKKAVRVVVKTTVAVATAPARLAVTAITAVPVIGNFVAQVTNLSPTISGSDDINLGPANNAMSPWGAANEIYTRASSQTGKTQADLTLYCVDCGVKGRVSVYGAAKWNLRDGLSALNANLNANLDAGINLGLVATAVFTESRTKPLIRQGIPNLGLAIKNVFSAGCYIAVDAVATLDVRAEGQALVGVTLSFPNFAANLNLINENGASGSSVTGLVPEVKRRFEASGTISANTSFSLPVSFNVGVEIVPLSFKRSLALVEEPGVKGSLTYAGSTGGAAPASETCNNGIQYSASLSNDVKFDFFGVRTFTLNHLEKELLSGCKLLGSSDTGNGGANTSGTTNGGTTNGGDTTGGTTTGGTTNGGDNNGGDTNNGDNNGGDNNGGDNNGGDAARRLVKRQKDTQSGDTIIVDDGEEKFASSSNPDPAAGPVDDVDDPNNSEFQANAAQAGNLADAASNMEDFIFQTIVEVHNVFQLVSRDDGNLYAGPAATGAANGTGLFATLDGVAAMDDSLRMLHYYPDVMTQYGASRIRVGDEKHLPTTSDFVGLRVLDFDNDSSTPNILFAVSSKGDVFDLVVCDYTNGAASKLFIVNGDAGITALQSEDLRYTVTGAPVSSCEPVALVYGQTAQ